MGKGAEHRYNILCAVLFAALICAPLLARITGWYRAPDISARENRQLAKRPAFDINILDSFPSRYQSWYNDHFYLREKMLDLHMWNKLNLLHESPFPDKVTIGKEGWLFDAGKVKDLYEGRLQIPPDGYRYVMQELHLRTLWYRARGIRFYVAIAPSKLELYPEYLPPYYHRAPAGTLTDRLVNVIRKDTVIRLITLKEGLLAEKNRYQLYRKMDTHWNYIGGYIAYREMMKEIRKDFPGVRPLELKDFSFTGYESENGNLAGIIGMNGKESEKIWSPRFTPLRSVEDTVKRYPVPEGFPYPRDHELRRYIPGSTQPTMMLICDSYGQYVFPYFSETFKSTFLFFDGWNYHLYGDIAEKERPDIIVLEIYEPNFDNLLNYSLDCLMAKVQGQAVH